MAYYKPERNTRRLEEGIEDILKESITNCLLCFRDWDLNGLHKNLKLYHRTISLIIANNRYEELSKKFDELEKLKREIEDDKKITQQEKLQFFKKADEIFVEFSKALKDEDFIFGKREAYIEGVDEIVEED